MSLQSARSLAEPIIDPRTVENGSAPLAKIRTEPTLTSPTERCHFCDKETERPHWHHPMGRSVNYVVPVHPQCHQKHHGIEYRDLGVYDEVRFLSQQLDGTEALRIKWENQLRSFEDYGLGENRITATLQHVGEIKDLEKVMIKELEKAVKVSPLGPFILSTPGLGLKTVGRLLGLIGDPAWHSRFDRSRTVSELWAYCGMHTVLRAPDQAGTDTHSHRVGVREAPKRRKKEKANWNGQARSILHVISVGMVKNRRSAYRELYDKKKFEYEQRNDDTTPLHRHNRALRAVSKQVLKDLWKASRDANQHGSDTHRRGVAS